MQDLLRLTTPLRHIAVPADVHKLMITRTGNRATRLCTQGMYNLLVAFREEHALPFFNFADLRKGAAAVIDQYTQSTKAVRKALQHRRTETSRLYLWSPHSIDRRYEGVLKFQGQMVTLAREQSAPRQETVTGMKCLDDPVIVARIVRAAMSLKELAARATLSADLARHFETVFRPTLHVIETRILPKIPKGVREKAAVIAKTLPDLPLME